MSQGVWCTLIPGYSLLSLSSTGGMHCPWEWYFIGILYEIALEIDQREVIEGIGGVKLQLRIIFLHARLPTSRTWVWFVLVGLAGAVALVVRDLSLLGVVLLLASYDPPDQVSDCQFAIKLSIISNKLLKS